MFVFLPPSERKTVPDPGQSKRLTLDSLRVPQLNEDRQQVLHALMAASGLANAQQILKVGATVMNEVEANRHLTTADSAPAHQIYTGVLFEALDADSLSLPQLQRAAERVLIFSGLFGVTDFTDLVPAYRLAMSVNLSPFGDARDPGPLSTFWQKALARPLAGLVHDQLVVDCRSSSYAAAYRAPARQTLLVNSFTEVNGRRKVVTHFAKHTRGELAGMLLRRAVLPTTVDEVAQIAAERWRVEVRDADGSSPHQLDLISAAE